jgi:hypothetical protein
MLTALRPKKTRATCRPGSEPSSQVRSRPELACICGIPSVVIMESIELFAFFSHVQGTPILRIRDGLQGHASQSSAFRIRPRESSRPQASRRSTCARRPDEGSAPEIGDRSHTKGTHDRADLTGPCRGCATAGMSAASCRVATSRLHIALKSRAICDRDSTMLPRDDLAHGSPGTLASVEMQDAPGALLQAASGSPPGL